MVYLAWLVILFLPYWLGPIVLALAIALFTPSRVVVRLPIVRDPARLCRQSWRS